MIRDATWTASPRTSPGRQFDLARVDSGTERESEPGRLVDAGCSRPDRSLGAVEEREDAVAGLLDDPAAQSVHLRLAQLVEGRDRLAPPRIAHPLGRGGRVDDIREEDRRQDPVVGVDRPPERPHPGEVVGLPRLVADDPAVMPGRDVEDHAGTDLHRRAVVGPDPKATTNADTEVVVLA